APGLRGAAGRAGEGALRVAGHAVQARATRCSAAAAPPAVGAEVAAPCDTSPGTSRVGRCPPARRRPPPRGRSAPHTARGGNLTGHGLAAITRPRRGRVMGGRTLLVAAGVVLAACDAAPGGHRWSVLRDALT